MLARLLIASIFFFSKFLLNRLIPVKTKIEELLRVLSLFSLTRFSTVKSFDFF